MTDKEKDIQVGDLVTYNIDKLARPRTPRCQPTPAWRWKEWVHSNKYYLFVVMGHEPMASQANMPRVKLMCLTNDKQSIITEKAALLSVITVNNKQLLIEQLTEASMPTNKLTNNKHIK